MMRGCLVPDDQIIEFTGPKIFFKNCSQKDVKPAKSLLLTVICHLQGRYLWQNLLYEV